MTELLLASKCCEQCLTTRNRIVSGERAAKIIRDCRTSGTHFICHKGSMVDKIVHCCGVHDRFGSIAYDFAVQIGVPIVEVNPDEL